jgi:CO/xanthine dehydrogenase FAD-binding subunit
MPKPKSLAGRVALITGGAGGIGRAIAIRLMLEGANVVLADIDQVALDATVALQGGFGSRDIAIEEFLQSRERQAGALVLSVSCTRPTSAEAFRYRKIARIKPKGGSVITLAAHLPISGGRIAGARIALGSMAPTQIRARAAERALEGRALDAATVAAAASAAVEGTSPSDNALGSAWYRREIVGVHLRRLLLGQE